MRSYSKDNQLNRKAKAEKSRDKVKNYNCKYCKVRFPMKMSLYASRSMNNLKQCCTKPACMAKAAVRWNDNKKKQARKDWNTYKKKEKEKLKTIADWKNDLQKEINWIVKQIDKDFKCISHPEMKNFLRWDAGHYYTVKAHSDIRFNFHNIHKQNSQANERYGGCPEYTLGLVNRYGQEYADMVLGLPLKFKGLGKEKYKINLIKNQYLPNARMLVREIKNGLIVDRYQANELIGIYTN